MLASVGNNAKFQIQRWLKSLSFVTKINIINIYNNIKQRLLPKNTARSLH